MFLPSSSRPDVQRALSKRIMFINKIGHLIDNSSIKFKFPINIKGDELTDIHLTNENRVEAVCLLTLGGRENK